MSSSADTHPIAPARFAAALKDLSIGMLHLKVLEIRNSIAHLQYSNDQLKPFAEGDATALAEGGDAAAPATAGPDQDCIDAIRENEQVIDRMAERIVLIRTEVEDRGMSWTEFQSRDEATSKKEADSDASNAPPAAVNGTTAPSNPSAQGGSAPSPWTDGTFQTGTIRNGEIHLDANPGRPQATSTEPQQQQQQQGGSLDDEQLRRALEERMRNLGADDEDDSGGLHL